MTLSPRFRHALRWSLGPAAIIWAVFLVEQVVGSFAFDYGLYPREIVGIRGIFTSPLLHGSWGHILSNTPPLIALSGLLFYFYPRTGLRIYFFIYLFTGLGVWLFGRSVYHIGASGVIYGLAAFLGLAGFFRRDFRAIIISLIVVFLYGGMVAGLFPGQPGISWESHLIGALIGGIAAWVFRSQLEDHEITARRRKADKEAAWRNEERRPFFPPDVFERRKEER
ncbi:MAG: rhomboid family intramembrane serine protease [Saprospiraceae bacterium]